MDVNIYFKILVIVLSLALLVLLVCAILAAVLSIKVLKSIRNMAQSGEKLAEDARIIGDNIKDNANVIEAVKTIVGVIPFFKKPTKGGE